MGFFKNLRENTKMAQYLRMYDALPAEVKSFFEEKEFVDGVSSVWDIQRGYEENKWPQGWPLDFVDKIPSLAEHFKWAKSEGAVDKDIIWWWNLPPVDRIIIQGVDIAYKRATLVEFDSGGLEPEEVMEKMKQLLVYTDDKPNISSMTNEDKEFYTSEDRPLPIEMHDRIDIYLKNNSDSDNLERMQQEKENFSSANAWIRSLIKKRCI